MLTVSMIYLFIFFSFFIEILYAQEQSKLPTSLKPEHYNLKILVKGDEEIFDGTVDILVKCCSETNNITLHAVELTIFEETISVQNTETGEELEVTDVKLVPQEEILRICLKFPLLENRKYVVHIEFRGELQTTRPLGFYVNTYVNEEGSLRGMLNTHFEPTYARYAFPCFDLPHLKATFEISIGRNEDSFSLSNMPLASTEPVAGREDIFWDHFQKTPIMSTYLLAYAVLNEGMKNVSNGRITFWYPPSVGRMLDSTMQRNSKMIFEFLENYFDLKYELPKMDFLIVNLYPPFAATESWGLVIFSMNGVVDIDFARETSTMTIAHELVHQWIGNIVNMKCFGEVWLKEGITSRITSVAKDYILDGQTLDTDTVIDIIKIMSDYSSDKLSSNCPETSKDILPYYSTISYFKGGLFTRMLEKSLGLGDFKKTTQLLLKKHKYQSILENDLWAALTETTPPGNFPAHFHMDVVWNSWTRQDGFPLVQVERNYKTGTATLTQSKFWSINLKDAEKYCWWIPISYTTKSDHHNNNTMAKSWMSCPKEPLQISNLNSSDWILANLEATGLFIVKYDDENWRLLSELLRDKNSFEMISHLDRFKLILDAFFLTDSGLMSHESLLTTLLFLQHETHYVVWKAALKYLDKIDWLEEEIVELKRDYMKKLVKPHFSKQIFNLTKYSLSEKKFQKVIIRQACFSEEKECIDESLRLFEEFKKSFPGEISIDKDMIDLVTCIALRFGPEENMLFVQKNMNSHTIEGFQMVVGFKCYKRPREKRKRMMRQTEIQLMSLEDYEAVIPRTDPKFQELSLKQFIDHEFHQPSEYSYLKKSLEELGLSHTSTAAKILRKIEDNMEWKKKFSSEIKTALMKILRNDEDITENIPTTTIKVDKPVEIPFRSKSCRSSVINLWSDLLLLIFMYYH